MLADSHRRATDSIRISGSASARRSVDLRDCSRSLQRRGRALRGRLVGAGAGKRQCCAHRGRREADLLEVHSTYWLDYGRGASNLMSLWRNVASEKRSAAPDNTGPVTVLVRSEVDS